MGAWYVSVLRLIVASKPFRGVLVSVATSCLIITATAFSIDSISLSPAQAATSYYGQAEAKGELLELCTPFQEKPIEPAWVRELTSSSSEVFPMLAGSISLKQSDQTIVDLYYEEGSYPSPGTVGRVELLSGNWPTKIGECVTTPSVSAPLTPAVGSWNLEFTGEARMVFSPQIPAMFCAPGTWQSWDVPLAARTDFGETVNPVYYFSGDSTQIASKIHHITNGQIPEDYLLETKQNVIKNVGKPRATSLLQLWAQLTFFPLAVGIVASSLLIRWGKRISEAMWKIGISRKRFTGLLVFGVFVASSIAGVLGVVAGSLVASLTSSALVTMNHGTPLNDEVSVLLPGLLAALIAVLGSVCAAVIGLSVRRKPRLDHIPRKTNQAYLRVVGTLLVIVAVGAAVLSEDRMWFVLSGALAMVAAAAAFTPIVLAKLTTWMDSNKLPPRTLASRIIADDLRRWGVFAASLTAVFGIVVALFGVASATVSAVIPLQRSMVPAGVTMLETHVVGTQDLSSETIEVFEHDLGVQNPIRVSLSLFFGDRGMIASFESIPDLVKAIGPLTTEQQELLNAGGIITPLVSGTKTVEIIFPDDSIKPIKAMNYSPAANLRYRTAGFSLTSAVPEQFQGQGASYQYLLYTGLTPEQDIQARNWPKDTGRTNVVSLAHYADAEFQLPLGVGLSLTGFGILFCPVVWVLLRQEAIYLRPIIAMTISVGIPKRWGANVLQAIAWLIIGPSAIAAVLATVLYLSILTIVYQGEVFDMLGVPWWVLVMFFAGLIAGTLAGVRLAIRKLHHTEAVPLV